MPRYPLAVLASTLAVAGAGLSVGTPPAHAGDGFRSASSADRSAMSRIARHRGLRGRYAYLTTRTNGRTFGVACGTSGGYQGIVPMRKSGGRWRYYQASSGALMTYLPACRRRR